MPKKDGEDEEDDGFNSDEWEITSNDSDESSTGWISVSSEGEDSDSDSDEPAKKKLRTDSKASELVEDPAIEAERIAKLATTIILTPADRAKLQELRREAKIDKMMGVSQSKRKKELIAKHIEDGLTAEDIELPVMLGKKFTKEERVALAQESKPLREEHKSAQGIRKSKKEAEGKSTANRLRAHIAKSKQGGRRRNGV